MQDLLTDNMNAFIWTAIIISLVVWGIISFVVWIMKDFLTDLKDKIKIIAKGIAFVIRKWMDKYHWTLKRIFYLACAAVTGAILFYCNFTSSVVPGNLGRNYNLMSGLSLLALGLPVFLTLWVFRTRDVKEQINISNLFGALSLFAKSSSDNTETTSEERVIGLKQLMYLRQQNIFVDRIDSVTAGSDLRDAPLVRADLRGVDLRGADLRDAHLQEAKLQGANLESARLYRDGLQGAFYDTDTKWPYPGFHLAVKGLILVPLEKK